MLELGKRQDGMKKSKLVIKIFRGYNQQVLVAEYMENKTEEETRIISHFFFGQIQEQQWHTRHLGTELVILIEKIKKKKKKGKISLQKSPKKISDPEHLLSQQT